MFYFLGDFNFPGIDCSMLASESSIGRNFFELIKGCGLNQFLVQGTYRHGNTLDLILSCADDLSIWIFKTSFSDQKAFCSQIEFSSENFTEKGFACALIYIHIFNNS